MKCPNCGGTLTDLTATANTETAPYVCEPCARGWWGAELDGMAREAWDASTRSFKSGDAKELIANAVVVERADRRRKKAETKETKTTTTTVPVDITKILPPRRL